MSKMSDTATAIEDLRSAAAAMLKKDAAKRQKDYGGKLS
jgi:hypothetical protein